MKIKLALVMSVDGKITQGGNPRVWEWTSEEDKTHFRKLLDESEVVIMGRKTYEVARQKFEYKKGRVRIVLTSNPSGFKTEEIPGQLEFTDESPVALVRKLKTEGKTRVLLVGGSDVAGEFLSQDLVDELVLTLEPWLFSRGESLVKRLDGEIGLELIEVERLNKQGALVLRYKITKRKKYES